MRGPVELTDAVLRKVRANGEAGARWLRELPDIVEAVERRWGVTVGATLAGDARRLGLALTGAAAIFPVSWFGPGFRRVTRMRNRSFQCRPREEQA